jgi:ureidoglycolate dehydrogenase (NAD+)
MSKPKRIFLAPEKLREFLFQVLEHSGVEKETALHTADGLWSTSLRGVDSHGVRLLPHYISGVKGGRINPTPKMVFNQTSLSCGTLNADHGFGHSAGVRAMDHAIELAKQSGMGFISVRNSNHCGALAYFAERACKEDMIGLAFTHATPKVRTPGSNRPFVGINPMCISAPMEGEAPFSFDAAPTPFSNNKIKQYAEDGIHLPPGAAADGKGIETLDPRISEMLLPIGVYKGFGMALVVEIFCGFLSGMPAGPDVSAMYGNSLSEKRFLAQGYGAIRIDSFEDVNIFKRRLSEMAIRLRNEPCVEPEFGPMLPGDPEKKAIIYRMKQGIPVTEGDFEKFKTLAAKFALAPPPQI